VETQTRAASGGGPTLVIEPKKGWAHLELRELWAYRELLYFLAWRNILIRYKQAVLGVAWAVLNPVVTMVVFTVIFNKLLGIGSGKYGVPYPIFAYAGLLPWNFFSGTLSSAGSSLVGSQGLLQKIYFPRLVIPTSAMLGTFPDFIISFVVLIVLMAIYRFPPTVNVLWLPLLLLLAMVTALGVSLWISAAYVLYRDVQYILPFLVQLWFFVSPVMYPTSKIPPGKWSVIYNLNPMTGVIGGFRWALLGEQPPSHLIWLSALMVFVIFIGGLYYFRRMERIFADVV